MSNHICKRLKEAPPGTVVKRLTMNGQDIAEIEKFVKYDRKTGLAFFRNKSGSNFVAICEKIDAIELEAAIKD